MDLRARLLAACAVALIGTGCAAEPGGPAGPGSLVVWNAEEIAVVDDGVARPLDTGGGGVRQVTPSSDGRIAWTAIEADAATVRIMGLAGEGLREYAAPTSPFFYHWRPDGASLGLLGNDPAGGGVLFSLLDPGEAAADPVDVAAPYYLDWSPSDGRLVRYRSSALLDILIPGADRGDDASTAVDRSGGLYPAPAWTDAGVFAVVAAGPSAAPRLVAVSLQAVLGHVVLIDPDTLAVSEVAPVGGAVRLYPNHDGSLLAIVEVTGLESQMLSIVRTDDASVIDRIDGRRFDLVQWSPAADRLLHLDVDAANTMLHPRIWSEDGPQIELDPLRPSASIVDAYLPFWDQYDRSISMWSFDGSRVALPAVVGDVDVVREIDIADGGVTTHEGYSMAAWAPTGP